MRILFAGVELAGWYENPAKAVTVNGVTVVDVVDIVRAERKKVFPRGNDLVTVGFAVARTFDSIKDAEVFALTHFSLMTKYGLCEIQCGGPDDYDTVLLAGAAVAASPQANPRGATVDVSYQVLAPGAQTDAPPQFLLGGEAMILRGRAALSAAATYVDVAFGTPFAAAPVVTATVAMPSGGDRIWATVRDDLTTTGGFRAEFSAPIPGAGYKLNWNAIG